MLAEQVTRIQVYFGDENYSGANTRSILNYTIMMNAVMLINVSRDYHWHVCGLLNISTVYIR